MDLDVFITFDPLIRKDWPDGEGWDSRPESDFTTDTVSVTFFRDPNKSLYDCFGPEVPQIPYVWNDVWMVGRYRVYVESLSR